MEKLVISEIVEAVSGQWLGDAALLDTAVTGVTSDSRAAGNGDLFVAFVGEKMNGHKFVPSALDAGAVCALVSEKPEAEMAQKGYILVENTVKAVGRLAAYYRRKFSIPVVAVTGSVGKTTTKDMIASVLSVKFKTLKTEGNFNNEIGVPRTLFRLDSSYEMAVVEMGMNHLEEISYLTRIAQPDVAVITNVGDAHIGNLGSRENILRAKCEIFDGLASGGVAVLNGDDTLLTTIRDRERQIADGEDLYGRIDAGNFRFHWIGEDEKCDFRAVDIQDQLKESVHLTAVTPEGRFPVMIPALGRHMLYAVMTAAAVGRHFGMTDEEIQQGVSAYVPTKMRMAVDRCANGIVLFNDTYNANPQSMKAGAQILANTEADVKVAVLGDMLELEPFAERLHREVGKYVAELAIDTLVTVGEQAAFIAEAAIEEGMEDVHPCEDKESAKEVLRELVKPETAFLFKASRGMALEELESFCKEIAGEEK